MLFERVLQYISYLCDTKNLGVTAFKSLELMKVYKFGGASVKSAEGIRNLQAIIEKEEQPLVVVISAMGKMTNALEQVVNRFFQRRPDVQRNLEAVMEYNNKIVNEIFVETVLKRNFIECKVNML